MSVLVPLLIGHDGGRPPIPPASGGAALSLMLPDGAVREPDDALPAVAVPSLPGARIAARVGYRSGPVTLRAACLAAPAKGWAPGIEEIVLDRATQLARESLGDGVVSFSAGERAAAGPGFAQRFEGVVQRDEGSFAVAGRHWLGFAGDPRDALVCTTLCTAPAGGTARPCAALIDAAAPTGAWAEAPPPSLVARTLLLAAERPREAAGVLSALCLAVSAVIIARRPRPRP